MTNTGAIGVLVACVGVAGGAYWLAPRAERPAGATVPASTPVVLPVAAAPVTTAAEPPAPPPAVPVPVARPQGGTVTVGRHTFPRNVTLTITAGPALVGVVVPMTWQGDIPQAGGGSHLHWAGTVTVGTQTVGAVVSPWAYSGNELDAVAPPAQWRGGFTAPGVGAANGVMPAGGGTLGGVWPTAGQAFTVIVR